MRFLFLTKWLKTIAKTVFLCYNKHATHFHKTTQGEYYL